MEDGGKWVEWWKMVENGWNGGRWWKMGGMVEDGGMVKKCVGGWNGGGWGSGKMENEVVRGSRKERFVDGMVRLWS